MYKKANSFLSILLVTILLFCSVMVPVNAIDTNTEELYAVSQVNPRFAIITSVSTTFSISGINSTSSAVLISQVSTSLYIKIELQKEKSSGYETIETWTKSGTGTNLILEKTRLINAFSNYRIKVTYTAGSESITIYEYPA